MNEISNTDKFFECFYGHYGKNVSNTEASDFEGDCNLNRIDNPVGRDEAALLFNDIADHKKPYVNLWGIRGLGKTSLVSMCVHDNRSRFGGVIYIPIEHSIEKDFVDLLKSHPFFDDLEEERKKLQDNVSNDFLTLAHALHNHKHIKGKINLLIFDINDSPENGDLGKQAFIRKIKRDSILPVGWEVLFISHSECDGCTNFPLNDSDQVFAQNLFDSLCKEKGITINESKRNYYIKELFYNPLLISVFVGQIEEMSNNSQLTRVLKKIQDKSPDQRGHSEANVKQVLGSLVKYRKLTHNQQLFVFVFMIWPTKYIPFDVICSFLNGYIVYYKSGKIPICHQNDLFKNGNAKKVNEIAKTQFYNALKSLVDYNLIVKDRDSESYQMHGLIADVLRGQYYKRIHKWWYKVRRLNFLPFRPTDHTIYINNVEKIRSRWYNKYKRIYIECVANSILWIKYNEPLCGKMSSINDILNDQDIALYSIEQKYKNKIETEENVEEKINLLTKFGEFYEKERLDNGIPGFNDTSLALIQYKKAIELSNKINYYSYLVRLYLHVSKVCDDKIDEIYKEAFDALCMLPSDFDSFKYTFSHIFPNKDSINHKTTNLVTFIIRYHGFVRYAIVRIFEDSIEKEVNTESKIQELFMFGLLYKTKSLSKGISGYDEPTKSVSLFDNAIDIYEHNQNAFTHYTWIVSSFIERAALSMSFNDLLSAVSLYLKHKPECQLNDIYAEVMNLLCADVDWFEKDDIKRCEGYYNFGCTLSDYYKSNKSIDVILKISRLMFNEANSILVSLPVESENPFKGFVKTSYCIYYPELDLKLIKVNGGEFLMGAQKNDPSSPNYDEDAFHDESPVHSVTLNDFYIGETQVTQRLWKMIMGNNPSRYKGDDNPVENVYWFMAVDFCNKLSQRLHLTPVYMITEVLKDGKTQKEVEINKDANGFKLPTEAEWEYAARGGCKSKGYKYNGSNTQSDVAWDEYYDDQNHSITRRTPMPVRTKLPNELGLYDMSSGNVDEWCQDWYDEDYYQKCLANPKLCDNPHGPDSGSTHVYRGGAIVERCRYRLLKRVLSDQNFQLNSRFFEFFTGDQGFRLVLGLPKEQS